MTNRSAELTTMLQTLKLPQMAASFGEVALHAARENYTHEAFLYELARQECEQRAARRKARHVRESCLPTGKTFQTLQLGVFNRVLQQQVAHLRTAHFVEEAMNVVAVGKPGTGKSHLAAALGYELIEQGHTVLWTSTATLMQHLLAAKRDLRLPRELARLDRFACVILDDIGYVQHAQDEMEILFTLLAERYERRSLVITTNLMFSEWERIFKHPMTTIAAIDRVVHHSVILDLMNVDSYRAREASEQQQRARATVPIPTPAMRVVQEVDDTKPAVIVTDT